MNENENEIRIFEQDDFRAIYIGCEFYKDLVVCSLSDLINILDTVHTMKEVEFVVSELMDRLKCQKDRSMVVEAMESLQSALGNVDVTKPYPPGKVVAAAVAKMTYHNEPLSKALDEPLALPMGNIGIDRDIMPTHPVIGYSVHDEMDIAIAIKEHKIEIINETYFPTPTEDNTKDSKSPSGPNVKKRLCKIFQRLIR